MSHSYAYLSAIEQVEQFRSGTLSPVDVLESQLAQERRARTSVNAFTDMMAEQAYAQAHAAATRYATEPPEQLPPLLGVTVAAKELHDTAGQVTCEGLPEAA